MHHPTRRLVTLLLVFGFIGAGTAVGQSADAIAQRLSDKYQSLTSLRAEFTQTMTSEYSDIRDVQSGSLMLQGDNYVLDTGNEVYARNGDDTWRYSHQDNQVIVSEYMGDEGSFSVNDLFFNYEEMFTIMDIDTENYDGTRHFRIEMEPRDPDSFFSEVTLWLRDRDEIITRIHMRDLNGTRMDFRLENVQLNPALAANVFAPPSDAEIINLR